MTPQARGLRFPRLLVVADLAYLGDEARWLEVVREVGAAARGEPVAVQVRAKQLDAEALMRLAARAREAVPAEVPLLLNNGDAALAAALGYSGVHWPEVAIPATDVMRPDGLAWRSAAVHSPAAIRAAVQASADVVVFGSVFEPGSKAGMASGLDALRTAVRATALPVMAIGGITVERVSACLDAGAHGVAVVSGVLGASSPAKAMRAYLDALAAHIETEGAGEPAQKGGFR